MYSEEIQNMVTSKAFVESLNALTCDYKTLERKYKNSLIDINFLEKIYYLMIKRRKKRR